MATTTAETARLPAVDLACLLALDLLEPCMPASSMELARPGVHGGCRTDDVSAAKARLPAPDPPATLTRHAGVAYIWQSYSCIPLRSGDPLSRLPAPVQQGGGPRAARTRSPPASALPNSRRGAIVAGAFEQQSPWRRIAAVAPLSWFHRLGGGRALATKDAIDVIALRCCLRPLIVSLARTRPFPVAHSIHLAAAAAPPPAVTVSSVALVRGDGRRC